MISAEQIQQIVAENESLQAEVLELNEILVIREEEIAELKKNASSDTELRSMMDLQLDELHLMQNRIGKHQRQAEGAEERELELYHELAQVTKLQQQYSELFQQYTYTIAQLEDIQAELAKVKKRNNMLQQIAVKIGELESNFENLTEERDTLKNKVDTLEKLQKT
jgi:chromosome segregation ATPase